MNIEKTISFILDHQANWEVRMAKAEERITRNDRQIEGILKLLKMGARQFARDAERMNRIDERLENMAGKIDILINSQIRADQRLALLEKKRNGGKPPRRKP
jgi:hypothetical protein